MVAGSGFVGERLKQKGFLKMDALEPSEGMLELAKAKKIYTRTFNAFHSPDSGMESNHAVYAEVWERVTSLAQQWKT